MLPLAGIIHVCHACPADSLPGTSHAKHSQGQGQLSRLCFAHISFHPILVFMLISHMQFCSPAIMQRPAPNHIGSQSMKVKAAKAADTLTLATYQTTPSTGHGESLSATLYTSFAFVLMYCASLPLRGPNSC